MIHTNTTTIKSATYVPNDEQSGTVHAMDAESSRSEETTNSALDDRIRNWRVNSLQIAAASVESFHKRAGEEQGILWPSVYNLLDAKLEEKGIKPGALQMKSAVMSSQSQAGNFCETLMVACGAGHLEDNGFSCDVFTSHQFQKEVSNLAKGVKDGSEEQKAAAAKVLSSKFMVTEDYAKLVLTPGTEVTYPDLVFRILSDDEDVVYICEQKLSGDNDSKAVTKNLDVLAYLKENFSVSEDTKLFSVILLPCSSEKLKSRWENSRQANPADLVLYNEEIFREVFRVKNYEDAFEMFLGEIANMTAEVLFGKLSPAGSTPEMSENGSITWPVPPEED